MDETVFCVTEDSSVLLWTGNPDCQTAHNEILTFLSENCAPFITDSKPKDNILRGNLGETITFCLGSWSKFGDSCLKHLPNALRPYSGKSNPEIDLLWMHIGKEPKDDWAVLQEVKTTVAASISYANNLIDDYDKLFGTQPRFTLHSRMQDFKNRLQYEQNRPQSILGRVSRMCGTSPATSRKIRLVPTVVHDNSAADVVSTMLAIRDTLVGREWHEIEPWAIGFSDLDSRLHRLARGVR